MYISESVNLRLVAELSSIGRFFPFNSRTELPLKASRDSTLEIEPKFASPWTSSRRVEIGRATLRLDLRLFSVVQTSTSVGTAFVKASDRAARQQVRCNLENIFVFGSNY